MRFGLETGFDMHSRVVHWILPAGIFAFCAVPLAVSFQSDALSARRYYRFLFLIYTPFLLASSVSIHFLVSLPVSNRQIPPVLEVRGHACVTASHTANPATLEPRQWLSLITFTRSRAYPCTPYGPWTAARALCCWHQDTVALFHRRHPSRGLYIPTPLR